MSNSCRQSDGRCAVCGGDWSVCGCQRIFDRSTAAAPTPPVDAVPGEPAAWTRPGFPGAFISNAEKIHGGDGEWERDYTIPLYAASVASRAACQHRVADARNAHVQSGYVCLDCGAIFQAADHGAASRAGSEPVMWQSRFFDSTSSVTPGWGKWEEVVPRNAYTDTVEDRLRELRHYIAAGYKYELRALYAIAPAAAAGGSEPVALADQAVAAPEAVGRVLAYINAAPAEWGEQLHAINGCKLFRADLAAIAAPSVLPAQEESFYVRFAKEWITASDNERKSIGEFVEGWGPIDPAVSAGEAQS
jgi:hypothetical protein